MPITVKKVGLDPKRAIQWRTSVDNNGITTTTATQHWIVVFSGAQDDPSQCYGATDGTNTVPVDGDAYFGSTDPTAPTVISVDPQLDPTSAGKIYKVQIGFSNANKTSNTGKWDVQVSFDGIPVQEAVYFDLDNNSYTNSAGQPFSHTSNDTYYDTAVSVAFKTDSFDESDAEALRGYLNSESITLAISALSYSRTFPAKTLKLENFKATPVVNLGQLAYWQVSLNFTYRALITAPDNLVTADGSGTPITGSISTLEYDIEPDLGYAYWKSGSPTSPTTITDDTGNPLNSQMMLDGQGDQVTGKTTPADCYFLGFRRLNTGDFSVLFTGIS